MTEKANKPSIRFKGFTDDWELRKLENIAKEVHRTDLESDAPVMMITAEYGFINQSERYAFNNAGDSLKKYILLKKGELAYNHGASKIRPFGSCFALKTAEYARIPFVYHCFAVDNAVSEFLSIELNGHDVERQLRKIVSSSARMDGLLNISFNEYGSIVLSLPSIPEQQKIADCFEQLDNLITLHQRKYDKLVNVKKSLLEKMFPSGGENVPKVRFKGFADAWEQRKLGYYFTERTERSAEGELISVTINSGIKKFSELNRHDTTPDDMSHYKVVCKGDIAYNSMRMWQGASGYSPYKGILSPAYTVITPIENVYSKFFAYLFKLPYMIYLFGVHSQGLTKDTWNLKFPAFSEIECRVPNCIEEQQAIALLLEQLDTLITLHQRKLEKIKNIKKSLLDKMFV